MKAYLLVSDDNVIRTVFNARHPGLIEADVDDVYKIVVGNDKFIDGKVIEVTVDDKSAYANEIHALKKSLADTDYQAIKFAEGELTADEYASMKAQRKAWRARINELELLIER